MGDKSSIEWTDATWNPLRGCSRVSAGCVNCYAERVAGRFSGVVDGRPQPYHGLITLGEKGPRWNGTVRMVPEHLADPLRWKKPRRIFVNSMSDLFHESVSNEDIAAIFGVMAAAPQHTFQVLTKRPKRMRDFFTWVYDRYKSSALAWTAGVFHKHARKLVANLPDEPRHGYGWPLPNVWLGVSVEDQKVTNDRIPVLLETPAAIRFVSYEPALEVVDFAEWIERVDHCTSCHEEHPPLGPDRCPACERAGTLTSTWGDRQRREMFEGDRYNTPSGVPRADGPELHWIIVGGESGPGARPFAVDWARSVVEQCSDAGVACFVKQLGAKPVEEGCEPGCVFVGKNPQSLQRLRDRAGGDMDEWPADLRVRQFPEVRS